jgi:hypothetical protein
VLTYLHDFVILLTRALCLRARCLHVHMMCIIQDIYTSFSAAQRPESLMLGTEHRILYTTWLKARTGSSSSMTVNNNKRTRNGADSCFLTTMIMIEKTLSFLLMMSLRCLLPLLPRPLEKAATTTTITIKKIQQHRDEEGEAAGGKEEQGSILPAVRARVRTPPINGKTLPWEWSYQRS